MTDDLRQRYAQALASTNTLDQTDLEYTLDALMDIRDAELEQVKHDALALVAEAAQERDAALARADRADAAIAHLERRIAHEEKRAEQAQAGVARVRRLCDMTIAASCRVQAIECAQDVLAELDRTT